VAYPDVASCPANLSRLVAQLPGLIYAQRGNELYVNLYLDNEATVKLDAGTVRVRQQTTYPWDGTATVYLDVDRPMTFTLKLRVPGWVGDAPFASDLYAFTPLADPRRRYGVHDVGFSEVPPSGWHEIRQVWQPGSFVIMRFPMPVRRVLAHAGVKDDAGRAAIQRGPVVYALEGVDNDGKVLDTVIPIETAFTSAFRSDLLGGVAVLTATLPAVGGAPARTITAVPYFTWANRARGEMVVWVRR
jgi:hypothetical protein